MDNDDARMSLKETAIETSARFGRLYRNPEENRTE